VKPTNRNRNYRIINLLFAGIILLVILYALIFNGSYPVPSAQVFTTQHLPSSGLSRSFSAIVRFDIKKAVQFNPYGVRIFSFFIVQLLLRLLTFMMTIRMTDYKLQRMIIMDIVLSVLLFGICFWPFIEVLMVQFAGL
jgi:hypothetical protein